MESLLSSIDQRVKKRAGAEIFSLRFPVFNTVKKAVHAEF
jgi:hypothetical protein